MTAKKKKQVQECHCSKLTASVLLSPMNQTCTGILKDYSRNRTQGWGTGNNRQRVKFKTDGGPQSASCKMVRGDKISFKE